jgi:hypothetical protein
VFKRATLWEDKKTAKMEAEYKNIHAFWERLLTVD